MSDACATTPSFQPGNRIKVPGKNRFAFVLFVSNTRDEMLVRFDGFAYNSTVPTNYGYEVMPDEPFRP